MSQREPTEEELAAHEAQMRKLTVDDVLLQTAVSLVHLAGRRLGLGDPAEKDLGQAKTGIEAVRALLPLCPEEQVGPLRDALSQLQMAFAREAQGAADEPTGVDEKEAVAASGDEGPPAGKNAQQRSDDAERAKARSKIWTPPGA